MTSDLSAADALALERQLDACYGLKDVQLERRTVPVNDVIVVSSSVGRYALKLYNTQSRNAQDVRWELDLFVHLRENGAPVVRPLAGPHGYVQSFALDGQSRVGALFEWAPGEYPRPERSTYVLLGAAAANIHQAADTFRSQLPRGTYDYDARVLIDEQLDRMQRHLVAVNRWHETVALGRRLKARLCHPALDRGICHMDLTLSNVHRDGDRLTVFDFDSAGTCWRAIEPSGVLRFRQSYFQDWLEGYRAVRPFSLDDERAVAAFGIVGDLRNVAWKLGVAESSRGTPLLTADTLPGVVDGWLDWEQRYLVEGV